MDIRIDKRSTYVPSAVADSRPGYRDSEALRPASVPAAIETPGDPPAELARKTLTAVIALITGLAVGANLLGNADPIFYNLLVPLVFILASAALCLAIRAGGSAQRRSTEGATAARDARAANARRDDQTGLANRLAFTERVEAASGRTAITVAAIGITSLRDVNETLGFAIGNDLLVAIAARLRAIVPTPNLVARLNGDVFALAIDADAGSSRLIVRSALERLTEPFEIGGRRIGLVINAGQATLDPSVLADYGAVIRWAETARDAARHSHRLLIIDELVAAKPAVPMTTSVRLPELRGAIANGDLVLHYQPYRERTTGRLSQAEALVRWRHPTDGLLSPGAFLPLAEAAGLMGDLDRWVLSEACRQARVWQDAGRSVRVAINASAASIHDPEYSVFVMRALGEHGLSGSAIEIEISEQNAFEGSDERLLTLAAELQALGVNLAIDDFGTGASSLLRLRNMPVETLKIDQSFITTSLSNPRDAAITKTIVGLAACLGLKTVAEGVEDAATLAYLDGLGVDYIQGYFVCRPVPPEDLFDRLPVSPGLAFVREVLDGGNRRLNKRAPNMARAGLSPRSLARRGPAHLRLGGQNHDQDSRATLIDRVRPDSIRGLNGEAQNISSATRRGRVPGARSPGTSHPTR